MQPNGQMPSPLPPQQPSQGQYDYILNPAQPPKKPFLFGTGKPNKIVMALFVLVVILLLMAAFAVYSSLTSKNYTSVVSLAERQEEIVRVADLGQQDATDPATRIYVATIRNVTLSEQNATLAFLKKKGVEVKAGQLALRKDATTDTALKTAKQNNTYDQVLLAKLNDELGAYQRAQKTVDGTNDTRSEQVLFATLLGNTKVITNAK